MDPVTAFQTAAAAFQFAELAVRITKRCLVFIELRDVPEDVKGPKAFIDSWQTNLGILTNVVRRIGNGLTSRSANFSQDELHNLDRCIVTLNKHGVQLEQLLGGYLPDEDSPTSVKLLSALKSFFADTAIQQTIERIKEPLPFLNSFLLTHLAFPDGSANGNVQFTKSTEPLYHISRHEVAHFVDRPTIVSRIDEAFASSTQTPKIVVLLGMGGQGKTQLALRYCNRRDTRQLYSPIFWIDASTRSSTASGIEELAVLLTDKERTWPDSNAKIDFVQRSLASTSRPWLLIFDNYDDPSAFDLRDFIPRGECGKVLITSRSQDTDRIGPAVSVSGMTEDEAIKLLLEGLKLGEDDKISSIASEIVQRLGCLPLAIAQASAYIEAENILPSEFLDRYEDSMREVLECIPPLWEYTVAETPAGDTKSAEVIAKTAFSTWNLSHRLLRPETPTGSWKSSVLSLLAKFHNHDISEEFFRSYFQTMSRPPSTRPEWTTLFEDDRAQWSSRKFGRLMREFSRLSLITRIDLVTGEAQLTVVSLHPLVRDWINLRQDNATSLENFKIFTCILGSHLSPFLHRKHRFETPFLAPRATYQCYGHICTWAAEFLKFRAILQPTALIASGEDPIPVCAELPLAIALFQQRDFDNACLVYRWLWDTCDVEVYQMRAIKMIAGTSISLSLLFTNLLQDSRDEARAQFDYWNKVQGASDVCDTILLTSLMEFAKALTDHGHSRVDAAKCKKLCEEKLAVLPRDDSLLVPRHTLMSCLARAAATLGNRTLATSLCRTMVQETAVLGGNGFRKHCWSDPQWAIVLEWLLPSDGICDCDVELVDEISTGGMEMHTEARRKGFSGNSGLVAYRSRFLVLTGRHEEAKAFVSVEAANLKEGWHTPSELRLLYRRLGNALECQSASDKAYEAFSEALRYTDPSPANGIRLGLLQDCGRTAMEFNPELAEAHFALRLSTLKQIGDFDEIAACYVELSRVRSQMGRRVGFQSCRDLLIRALEIWGLQVCVHGLQRECEYPGHIETTLVLNEQEPTQVSPAKEVVSDCLAKRKSCWYGYQVLAELASTLALTGFYTESITAFQIAKDVFESNKDTCAFKDIRYFIGDAVAYIRDSWDGIEDDERISGTITWAEVLLAERRGHEPSEDPDSWYGADDSWWEDEKRSLLELLEPEADSEASSSSSGAHSASERDELPAEEAIGEERVKRANPFRTLAARLSSTLSDGASGKSSTSSRWSIGRGLRPSASVAAAPAKPKVS